MLDQLLETAIKENASDLHLAEGRPPVLRVGGFLVPLLKSPVPKREDIEMFLAKILPIDLRREFEYKKEVNFAYTHTSVAGVRRFRSNAFTALGKLGVAMRLVPSKIRSFAELNLPPTLEIFAKKQQGFFLVVGPSGSGKSTTLAALIESINTDRLEHIVTVEDPIEYIFEPKKALIDQREVKIDTPDFSTALRGMFRQDADVMMVGEMRDAETIATAVTAAETGHLVFSTLHTNTASQTVNRIIDSFPANQQGQIRLQLSESLLGIFSQRLVPRISGGLVPAYELLINTYAVSNLIREERTHEIDMVIETGSESGMIDLNRSLADLVRRGEITAENALLYSANPKMLERIL